VGAEERLWHPVPRLDAPDRVWLLPTPVAKWLGAGLFSGPLAAQLLVFFDGQSPVAVWGDWRVWLVWLTGMLLGGVGAFYRPGGVHLGGWANALVDYHLLPQRAVWKPVGRGPLWW
jgi:hypothetical protein